MSNTTSSHDIKTNLREKLFHFEEMPSDGSLDSILSLFMACYTGELTEFFENGCVNINVFDKWRRTPLHWASRHGHARVVRSLLTLGADINVADKWGLTAMHWACLNGHKDVIDILSEFLPISDIDLIHLRDVELELLSHTKPTMQNMFEKAAQKRLLELEAELAVTGIKLSQTESHLKETTHQLVVAVDKCKSQSQADCLEELMRYRQQLIETKTELRCRDERLEEMQRIITNKEKKLLETKKLLEERENKLIEINQLLVNKDMSLSETQGLLDIVRVELQFMKLSQEDILALDSISPEKNNIVHNGSSSKNKIIITSNNINNSANEYYSLSQCQYQDANGLTTTDTTTNTSTIIIDNMDDITSTMSSEQEAMSSQSSSSSEEEGDKDQGPNMLSNSQDIYTKNISHIVDNNNELQHSLQYERKGEKQQQQQQQQGKPTKKKTKKNNKNNEEGDNDDNLLLLVSMREELEDLRGQCEGMTALRMQLALQNENIVSLEQQLKDTLLTQYMTPARTTIPTTTPTLLINDDNNTSIENNDENKQRNQIVLTNDISEGDIDVSDILDEDIDLVNVPVEVEVEVSKNRCWETTAEIDLRRTKHLCTKLKDELMAIKPKLAEKDKIITDLSSMVKDYQIQISSNESRVHTLSEANSEFNGSLIQISECLSHMKTANSTLEKEVDVVKELLALKTKELKNTIIQLRQVEDHSLKLQHRLDDIGEVQDALETSRADVKDRDDKLIKMSERFMETRMQIVSLEAKCKGMQELKNDLLSLKKQLVESRIDIETKDKDLLDAQQLINERIPKQEYESLEAKYISLENEMNVIQNHLNVAFTEITSLKTVKISLESELADTNHALRSISADKSKLKTHSINIENELIETKTILDDVNIQLKRIKEIDLKQSEVRCGQLQTQLDGMWDLNAELESLRSKLADTEKNLIEKEVIITENKNSSSYEIENIMEDFDNCKIQIGQLQEELIASVNDRDELVNELQRLQTIEIEYINKQQEMSEKNILINDYLMNISILKDSNQSLEEELSQTKRILGDITTELSWVMDEQLKGTEERCVLLQTQLEDTKFKLVEKENHSHANDFNVAWTQIEHCQSALALTEQAIATVKTSLQGRVSRERLNECEERCVYLQTELDIARESLRVRSSELSSLVLVNSELKIELSVVQRSLSAKTTELRRVAQVQLLQSEERCTDLQRQLEESKFSKEELDSTRVQLREREFKLMEVCRQLDDMRSASASTSSSVSRSALSSNSNNIPTSSYSAIQEAFSRSASSSISIRHLKKNFIQSTKGIQSPEYASIVGQFNMQVQEYEDKASDLERQIKNKERTLSFCLSDLSVVKAAYASLEKELEELQKGLDEKNAQLQFVTDVQLRQSEDRRLSLEKQLNHSADLNAVLVKTRSQLHESENRLSVMNKQLDDCQLQLLDSHSLITKLFETKSLYAATLIELSECKLLLDKYSNTSSPLILPPQEQQQDKDNNICTTTISDTISNQNIQLSIDDDRVVYNNTPPQINDREVKIAELTKDLTLSRSLLTAAKEALKTMISREDLEVSEHRCTDLERMKIFLLKEKQLKDIQIKELEAILQERDYYMEKIQKQWNLSAEALTITQNKLLESEDKNTELSRHLFELSTMTTTTTSAATTSTTVTGSHQNRYKDNNNNNNNSCSNSNKSSSTSTSNKSCSNHIDSDDTAAIVIVKNNHVTQENNSATTATTPSSVSMSVSMSPSSTNKENNYLTHNSSSTSTSKNTITTSTSSSNMQELLINDNNSDDTLVLNDSHKDRKDLSIDFNNSTSNSSNARYITSSSNSPSTSTFDAVDESNFEFESTMRRVNIDSQGMAGGSKERQNGMIYM